MKFKNYCSIKGTKEDLEAFAKKLNELGYEYDEDFLPLLKTSKYLHNYPCDMSYGYLDCEGYDKDFVFQLPEQVEEAIRAVSRTE